MFVLILVYFTHKNPWHMSVACIILNPSNRYHYMSDRKCDTIEALRGLENF
jgi:hypothetical protein